MDDNINTPAVETPAVETPAVETPAEPSILESGGETARSFDLTFWVVTPLLIVASLYSIYYHRQALNKLHENDKEKDLQAQIDELKGNLKTLMGTKYKMI